MTFQVQFRQRRRGVSEVIRTVAVAAADGPAALTRARSLAGTRFWPPRTDALRVMDEGGRTLIDWLAPTAAAQPHASIPVRGRAVTHDSPGAAAQGHQALDKSMGVLATRHHVFDIGQSVSYRGGATRDVEVGGYEVVECSDPGGREPRYAIRHPDGSSERVVQEHEIRKTSGAHGRGA